MNKIEGETYNLIEEMMINNCRWSNERTLPKKAVGKFNVDALTLLTAKIDIMTQNVNNQNVNTLNAQALLPTYDSYGSFHHVTLFVKFGTLFT